jgi:hypothetical protein
MICTRVRRCLATIVLLLAPHSAWSVDIKNDFQDIDWSNLVDEAFQNFDDPYRDLERDQLISLVTVATLREKAEGGESIDEAELAMQTKTLVDAGIDVDNLIEQRWIVAESRKQAATRGNESLDGTVVNLSGFIIPAPPDSDGASTAYLVPERGMCSHMPPPSPNQMVRVRWQDEWRPRFIYEPVRLTGRLVIDPNERSIVVVDGLVSMQATYTMDVVEIEPMSLFQPTSSVQRQLSGASKHKKVAPLSELGVDLGN